MNISLEGMQNSAASCCIVCALCLVTAAVLGIFSVKFRCVTLVTVTGVLYVLAGNRAGCCVSYT